MDPRPFPGRSAARLARLPVPAAGLLLALVALAAPAGAQCAEDTFRGRVTAVDVAAGTFRAANNVLVPPGLLYAVDGATDFNGVAGSLDELQVGHDVVVRYCFNTNPRLVLRLDSTLPAQPPAGALIVDLALPPGQEAVPVTRVFGDDVGEGFGGVGVDGLAFGDVDGDGYDDLVAVGGRSPVAGSKAAVVVYGGPDAAGASLDLNTDGAVSAHGETRLQPTLSFQNIGRAVGCADLDGDGRADVLIGEGAGIQVVFGGPTLRGTVVPLDPAAPGPGQFLLRTELTPQALASGDLNGDGIADLIADGGVLGVIVVYGGPGLRGTTLDLRNPAGAVPGVTRVLTDGLSGDGHVSSIDTGDLNGDGVLDLLIALQRGISPALNDAVVVFGSAALPGTVVTLGATPVGTPPDARFFGRGMDDAACGDFDGDGYDDVLLATHNVTGPGDNFAVGQIAVVYGGPSLPGTDLSFLDPVGPNETRITGLEEFGELGRGLAAADVDADGRFDLVLPAPGAVPYGTFPELNVVTDGAVYVFRGRTGLRGQELLDPREVADVYVFAAATNDGLGTVVAAGGDLDRDGRPELAATAVGGDNASLPANNGAGYAAVLFRQDAALGTVTVRRASRAGDGFGGLVVPKVDFGPVVRAKVDFSDHDASAAGFTTATLEHPSTPGFAAARWTLSTERSGWVGAALTFRYTDAEIAGLDEATLGLFRADTPAGPFFPVPVARDLVKNEVRANVTALGVFALGEQSDAVAGVLPYGCGTNPEGSLLLVSGPVRPGATFQLGIDNPLGTQAVGSIPILYASMAPQGGFPCGPRIPGLGMPGPAARGEVLLGLPTVVRQPASPWLGPGTPSVITLQVPSNPNLPGQRFYFQGLMLDRTPGAPVRLGLTTAFEIEIQP